jgi:hypothetical protein
MVFAAAAGISPYAGEHERPVQALPEPFAEHICSRRVPIVSGDGEAPRRTAATTPRLRANHQVGPFASRGMAHRATCLIQRQRRGELPA